jgi:hypothetical protein
MKNYMAGLATVLLLSFMAALGQNVATDVGHGTKKAATKTADVSKSAATDADTAGHKGVHATRHAANDTGKAAKKTGHGLKKGVSKVGHAVPK